MSAPSGIEQAYAAIRRLQRDPMRDCVAVRMPNVPQLKELSDMVMGVITRTAIGGRTIVIEGDPARVTAILKMYLSLAHVNKNTPKEKS